MIEEKELAELIRLKEIYETKEKEYTKASQELEKFVNRYLKENGMEQDAEHLLEIIDVLPGGIIRFKMLERYYALVDEPEQSGQQLM